MQDLYHQPYFVIWGSSYLLRRIRNLLKGESLGLFEVSEPLRLEAPQQSYRTLRGMLGRSYTQHRVREQQFMPHQWLATGIPSSVAGFRCQLFEGFWVQGLGF